MGIGLISLMAAVILGGTFGSATATVESIDGEVMVVEIGVEVFDPADSVVAHLTFDGEELILPLLDRGDGTFGIRTELAPRNYGVVFETLGEGGERSDSTTLARMGADLGSGSGGAATTVADDEALSEESQSLLWLAIALGAASLSLIAFWVLGSRDEVEDGSEESHKGDESTEEE
jgi:hypothetical protein